MTNDTRTADLAAAEAAVFAEEAASRTARVQAKAVELRKAREQQAADQAQAALIRATVEPQAAADVLVCGSTAYGQLGDGPGRIVLLSHTHCWVPRAAFAALPAGWQARCRRDLFERSLLVCREPHADLRSLLASGFVDDLHDTLDLPHARVRPAFMVADDARRVDDLFFDIVRATSDGPTLLGWRAAATDEHDLALLDARIANLASAGLLRAS